MLLATVAIFVLATTKQSPSGTSSFLQSRIVPLVSTWGGYFPSLYLVFGTNLEDWMYVTSSSCRGPRKPAALSRRKLVAKSPQVSLRDVNEIYDCSEEKVAFRALWVANCTGEYFGYGPVCRCQEAMRFYLNSDDMKNSHDWFAFIDDDVYLRPYALSSMLQAFLARAATTTKVKGFDDLEVVLVSTRAYRSFQFSKAWVKAGQVCNISHLHNFPVAMPAIISRNGMKALRSAIDASALTNLQKKWGGSGDAVLGFLLWQYEMQVYSFADSYIEVKSIASSGRKNITTTFRPFNKSEVVVVHSVKNMKNLRSRLGRLLALPSHADVADFCGDMFHVRFAAGAVDGAALELMQSQTTIGLLAASKIFRMTLGDVTSTRFKKRVPKIRDTFQLMEFADCAPA